MNPSNQTQKPSTDKSGLANEDQPIWAPPESQPEPRPADPILKPSPPSNPKSTKSPA